MFIAHITSLSPRSSTVHPECENGEGNLQSSRGSWETTGERREGPPSPTTIGSDISESHEWFSSSRPKTDGIRQEDKKEFQRSTAVEWQSSTDSRTQLAGSENELEHSHAVSAVQDIVMLLALFVHSIFEGLAVGLEMEANDVWKLFAGTNYIQKSPSSIAVIMSKI